MFESDNRLPAPDSRGPDSTTARDVQAERELASRLQRLLESCVSDGEPGVVIGVYRDGAAVATASAGLASLEHGVPLSVDTPLDIASVSKQFAATTILIAARDGVLDLDADIRAHLPELRVDGVTIRHCLQHTSGLPDYLSVCEAVGIPPATAVNYEAFLSWLSTVDALDYQPGTDIFYSNTGYVVAAIAAERQAGIAFPDLVTANVLTPLGMSGSTPRKFIGQVIPGMAFSYSPQPQGQFLRHEMGDDGDVDDSHRNVDGDGDLLASISDFAQWHGFLLDGRVLGKEIRDQLLQRSVLADGTTTTYGMGIHHERIGGTSVFGHSGAMWGYQSRSLTDPESGIGVAAFANRNDLEPSDLAWRALRLATDTRNIAGPWYSAQIGSGLDVSFRSDGGLDVSDGGHTAQFDPGPEQTWQSPFGVGSIRIDDQVLSATDELGRKVHYRRMTPGAQSAVDVTGTYREPVRGAAISICEDTHGQLQLLRGTMQAVPLRYIGSVGTNSIFSSDLGWLRADSDQPDTAVLVAGSTALTLRKQNAGSS